VNSTADQKHWFYQGWAEVKGGGEGRVGWRLQ
jgi:hypothetical protein